MMLTLADWLVVIGAVALGVSILILLVEIEAIHKARADEAMRRNVNREDQQ